MKPLIFLLLISFSAKAQVFKSPVDAPIKTTVKEILIPAQSMSLIDSIPKPIWKTTMSPDRIVSASLMLSKADGSIIIIDSAWKMNVKKEFDKVAVIYPDSTRVIYRVVDRHPKDTLITIPFEITKKRFDAAQKIKLEIIR